MFHENPDFIKCMSNFEQFYLSPELFTAEDKMTNKKYLANQLKFLNLKQCC